MRKKTEKKPAKEDEGIVEKEDVMKVTINRDPYVVSLRSRLMKSIPGTEDLLSNTVSAICRVPLHHLPPILPTFIIFYEGRAF